MKIKWRKRIVNFVQILCTPRDRAVGMISRNYNQGRKHNHSLSAPWLFSASIWCMSLVVESSIWWIFPSSSDPQIESLVPLFELLNPKITTHAWSKNQWTCFGPYKCDSKCRDPMRRESLAGFDTMYEEFWILFGWKLVSQKSALVYLCDMHEKYDQFRFSSSPLFFEHPRQEDEALLNMDKCSIQMKYNNPSLKFRTHSFFDTLLHINTHPGNTLHPDSIQQIKQEIIDTWSIKRSASHLICIWHTLNQITNHIPCSISRT